VVTALGARVVLVDDHPAMRAGVRSVLERAPGIDVVGEAATGKQALAVLERTNPDVVFLDIGLPDVDGISLVAAIRRTCAKAKVVMLTCQTDAASVHLTFDAGVSGYLTKAAAPREIVDAVRKVSCGQMAVSADVVRHLVSGLRREAPGDGPVLTAREREVWKEVARGFSNRQIAGELFLSEHTVKFHVHNLLRKLGLRTRAEAICVAHQSGMTLD
jgi:DNA-binding NarL/FixJ family response regulator